MKATYYPGLRPDLEPYLVEAPSVLDVGCGAGGLAHALRRHGATRVVGIESSSLALEAAHLYDKVHHGKVEEILPTLDESFDFVVLADVLEHLIEPWSVLRDLRQHVKDRAAILISIPNVSHVSIVHQLVRHQDWRFDDSGIFDRTHLRWFGRRSLHEMIVQAGFKPMNWAANISIGIRGRRWERTLGPKKTRWVPSFLVLQWIVVCQAVEPPPA